MTVSMEKFYTEKISSTAKGIFLVMLKAPDRDYSTLDEICGFDAVTPAAESKRAVNELIRKNYLFKLNKKNQGKTYYAVNKFMACQMAKVKI